MNKEVFEKMLKDFQELNVRTNSCRDFIMDEERFKTLDMINRDLLIAQLKAMETYLSILSIRLGINGTPENLPAEPTPASEETATSDAEKTADAIIAGE